MGGGDIRAVGMIVVTELKFNQQFQKVVAVVNVLEYGRKLVLLGNQRLQNAFGVDLDLGISRKVWKTTCIGLSTVEELKCEFRRKHEPRYQRPIRHSTPC